MEYNHMEELGFTEDRQLMCTSHGFIARNDSTRNICARFIRNGDRLYDIVTAYDNIVSFVLNRDGFKSGDSLKLILPFIKAGGATDSSLYELCRSDLKTVSGIGKVMKYLSELIPTVVVSGSYEHQMMAICDAIDFPISSVQCTQMVLDSVMMDKQEAKAIREMATEITKMKMPTASISTQEVSEMSRESQETILALDDIFIKKFPKMECNEVLKSVNPIGGNEKAYSLLEMRRRTEVELDSTAFIGSGLTDYPAMDIVRDSNGLSMSFNGDEYAVRGCNVAVMSTNAVVAAVLVAEFYNEGTEAVFDLIGSWDRSKLEKRECPDRHLMNSMLRSFPTKLPSVRIVDDDSLESVMEESNAFRKKLSK